VYDPRYRLQRVVLGDSVLTPRVMSSRLERPEMVRERLVSVPDRDHHRVHKTRTTQNIATAEPNAPKLIRLIRTPYALERSGPKRVDDHLKREARAESRRPHGEDVRATMGESRVPRLQRVTRDGSIFERRPRVSIDDWLTSPAANEEVA